MLCNNELICISHEYAKQLCYDVKNLFKVLPDMKFNLRD